MADLVSWLRNLLLWLVHGEEIQTLVLQIEDHVRVLCKLQLKSSEQFSPDILATLKFVSSHLDNLSRTSSDTTDSVETTSPPSNQTTTEEKSVQSWVPEPELSKTAKQLIKLRDWVLFGITNSKTAEPVLEELYQQLGQILELEEVISLESLGQYDRKLQKIVGTQDTEEQAKDNLVCSTARPGYLFHGKPIRPQEVIVYVFKSGVV